MALLLQNGKSTLIKTQTDIKSVTAILVRAIRQMRINSLSPFSLHLITVAWHTPSAGLSLVAACCSIETCKKKMSFKYAILKNDVLVSLVDLLT